MCGGAKKDIEKSWESVGIGPRTSHPMVRERGQLLNISRIPELDFLVSAANLRDGPVSPPRCLHKLNIQSFGAEAAARSSSDVHSHTWQHTFVSLSMRNKNINYPPVATLPFLPLSHMPHIF